MLRKYKIRIRLTILDIGYRPLVDLHRDFVTAVGCPSAEADPEAAVKCLRNRFHKIQFRSKSFRIIFLLKFWTILYKKTHWFI
jgi:hypothetical protein